MSRSALSCLSCLPLLAILAWPQLALAQDAPAAGALPKVGLGVEVDNVFGAAFNLAGNSINTLRLFEQDNTYKLYVPINLSNTLRVEPVVGFVRATSNEQSVNNNVEVFDDNTTTAFSLGVGGFALWALTDSIHAYGGGRLAFNRISVTTQTTVNSPGNTNISTVTNSRNGIQLQGALGTEWFFNRYMSFGGEGQLNIRWFGTPTRTVDPDPGNTNNNDGDSESDTFISPNVELFLRFYFM